MGPTSMPSVPLMVGCGVSCTALLILLLIYAAFWRWEHTHTQYTHDTQTWWCHACVYIHTSPTTIQATHHMCVHCCVRIPVRPNKEQMVQLQQGVVISFVVTHMTDGKIKLMTLQCPKSCCSVHQSVINTFLTSVLSVCSFSLVLCSVGISVQRDRSFWWIFASPSWPPIYWFWLDNLKLLAR